MGKNSHSDRIRACLRCLRLTYRVTKSKRMFEMFGSLEFFVVELSTFSQPLASAESPVRKEFHDLGDPTMLFQPKFSRGEKALLKRSANQKWHYLDPTNPLTSAFSTTTHHFPNIFWEKKSDVTLKNSPQTSPPW